MTDTEVTETIEEPPPNFDVPEDPVPPALYSYGLGGEPLRMAPSTWQPAVDAIRRANVGALAVADVQPIIDSVFPGAGYLATDLCLAAPPTGAFTVTVDPGDEGGVATFTAADDVPDANVQWDFGDGSASAFGRVVEHPYAVGEYLATVNVAVAGTITTTSESVQVADAGSGEAPMSAEFSPADHTVDEVVAYAEENPDEIDRLIGEEENGKARVTLLERLHALAG